MRVMWAFHKTRDGAGGDLETGDPLGWPEHSKMGSFLVNLIKTKKSGVVKVVEDESSESGDDDGKDDKDDDKKDDKKKN